MIDRPTDETRRSFEDTARPRRASAVLKGRVRRAAHGTGPRAVLADSVPSSVEMLFVAAAVGIALLVPLFTRGSYRRLLDTDWRWGGLLFLGLGLQVVLEFVDVPEDRWHDVGFGLLIASYVLVVGFCVANLLKRGMAVVLVGVLCNLVAIAVNQGMPYDPPADWDTADITSTVKHHPQDSDDEVLFLTDIILLPGPAETLISFGDLILAVGLIDLTYQASRRPRRRRAATPESESESEAHLTRDDDRNEPAATGELDAVTAEMVFVIPDDHLEPVDAELVLDIDERAAATWSATAAGLATETELEVEPQPFASDPRERSRRRRRAARERHPSARDAEPELSDAR